MRTVGSEKTLVMQEDNLDNKGDITNVFKTAIENIALKEDLKNSKENNLSLLQNCKELLENLKASESKRLELEYELEKFKSSFESPDELYKMLDELKDLRVTDKIQKQFLDERDYIPVTQFNDLFWGDNYPALKVLFDYLQRMNCLDVNWSYFSNCMCVGNFTIINLKSAVLGKHDIGYLLAIIKDYFKDDCNGTAEKYLSIIARKFTIDSTLITKAFFDKYIREYKKGKIPVKLRKVELDNLSAKIADAYR